MTSGPSGKKKQQENGLHGVDQRRGNAGLDLHQRRTVEQCAEDDGGDHHAKRVQLAQDGDDDTAVAVADDCPLFPILNLNF